MIPPCDTSRWLIFRLVYIRIRGHAGPLHVQALNMAPGLKSDGVDEVEVAIRGGVKQLMPSWSAGIVKVDKDELY